MNRTDYAAATIVAYALFMLAALDYGPSWLTLPYFAAAWIFYGAGWARQHRRDRIARIQTRLRRYRQGGTI